MCSLTGYCQTSVYKVSVARKHRPFFKIRGPNFAFASAPPQGPGLPLGVVGLFQCRVLPWSQEVAGIPVAQRLCPLRDASASLTMYSDMPGTFGCLPRERRMQKCSEREKMRGKAYGERHSWMLTPERAALFVPSSLLVYVTKIGAS